MAIFRSSSIISVGLKDTNQVNEPDPALQQKALLTVNIEKANPSHIVRRHQFQGAASSYDPFDIGASNRCRLDLDVSGLTTKAGESVRVQLFLDDPLYYFDTTGFGAVTAGDQRSFDTLRNLKTIRSVAGRTTGVEFFSVRNAPTGAWNPLGSFNIRVVAIDDADGSFTMPSVLDPGIKNDG